MREARTRDEIDAALRLRHAVFCEEQGVDPPADRDGRDDEAVHVVALDSGDVVGTFRLLIENGDARLGRMAVERACRGCGLGARLLEQADRSARDRGVRRIRLHAQTAARGVYDRAGYEAHGEPFLEEGIEHVTMEKALA